MYCVNGVPVDVAEIGKKDVLTYNGQVITPAQADIRVIFYDNNITTYDAGIVSEVKIFGNDHVYIHRFDGVRDGTYVYPRGIIRTFARGRLVEKRYLSSVKTYDGDTVKYVSKRTSWKKIKGQYDGKRDFDGNVIMYKMGVKHGFTYIDKKTRFYRDGELIAGQADDGAFIIRDRLYGVYNTPAKSGAVVCDRRYGLWRYYTGTEVEYY